MDSTQWHLVDDAMRVLEAAVGSRNAEVAHHAAQRIAKLVSPTKPARKRGRKRQEVALKTGQRVKLYRDRIEALSEDAEQS